MSLERGVAVIGSANLDLVVSLERFPDAGETVMGERLEEVAGGKGLNQAIAAARGGDCAFIGSVGEDEAGRLLLEQLERAGVDATQVVHRPEPTGAPTSRSPQTARTASW
jgi:ribokinase